MRLIILLVCFIQAIQCARILGVYHTPGYSHFKQGEALFKELAARGHEVTVLSPFPQKEKIENYIDLPLGNIWDAIHKLVDTLKIMDNHDRTAVQMATDASYFGLQLTNITIHDDAVRKLLDSNETYDVIIMEHFVNEAYFGLAHHFKAPLILVSPSITSLWTNIIMGNPTPYSYIPSAFLNYSPDMNLWQRAYNTFVSICITVHFYVTVLPQQNEVLHEILPDAPPIEDLIYNASLMLVNSHPVLRSPVPLQPNMIEIGGFHVQKDGKLPEELKKYLDDATEGVIYFAMGSNFQSKNFPPEKRQAILSVLSKLKMKVLWKFEEELPDKPANVRIEKWLPQSAVLAHKNVKIFISHGGRLSTTESIYFGKPVLGLPMFAEQFANIQEAVYCGYGLYLSYEDLNENNLQEALTEMIENPKYAKEAKYRSDALHSLPVSPLDNAMNWIEYVIKHKGAPHLRNAGLKLAWYQHLLLDVLLVFCAGLWLFSKLVRVLFSLCRKSGKGEQKVKTT